MNNHKHGRHNKLTNYVLINPDLRGDIIVWEVWVPILSYHDTQPYIEFESPSCHTDCDDQYCTLEDALDEAKFITTTVLHPYREWLGLPIKIRDMTSFEEDMDIDDWVLITMRLKYKEKEYRLK
jgi:hypothetical protein